MRLRIAELARQRRGWSMRKLAQVLQVDHQTVLLWNIGRSYPRLPMLLKLSRLFRCTIEHLIDGEPLEE